MSADVFTADFSNDLRQVQAKLCFDGQPPTRLYRNKQAGAFVGGIYHNGKKLKAAVNGSRLPLPTLPGDACIEWRTDFEAALGEKDRRLVLDRNGDLVMSADLWFWRGPQSRAIVVDIKLPDGVSVSTPWAVVKDAPAGKNRFRPDATPPGWSSRFAVGHFEVTAMDIPGAQIRLAVIGGLSAARKEKITVWIKETVTAVTTVHGRFPQPQPQVLVVPIGARDEAVLMAHVIRGGGLAAEFFVDETRPLQEFVDDWTATHEFSHMLMPYVSIRDRWLSEGIASYYQNVLRARNGRLTETKAWQKPIRRIQAGRKCNAWRFPGRSYPR